jgi:Brp/Blh family beta-carotene 15,15'-monooxygenase
MNVFSFIYLIGIYLLLTLFNAFNAIDFDIQLIYASFFILVFGIPHGAIDHVLFFRKRKLSQFKFYAVYLGLIALFLMLWYFSSVYSLLLFLIISAFHFGESQFNDLSLKKGIKYLFYFFWGSAILVSLIFYNLDELTDLSSYFKDTMGLTVIYDLPVVRFFFYVANVGSLTCLAILLYLEKLKKDRFCSEIFLFVLIHITFFLFPFIIGFTLYFVVLHSLQVMYQEFNFFKCAEPKFTIFDFLKILLPYSLVSIVFSGLILGCSYLGFIDLSMPFLSLVIISVITLPHAIVMNIFYNE